MKSKEISILLITIIMIFSLTPIVQAANVGDRISEGILGDVDGNGKINSSDALLVLQVSVGIKNLDERQKARADVYQKGIGKRKNKCY